MKTNIQLLQKQVDEVKSVMIDNIQRALDNTESIESLLEKSERLAEQAKVFKRRTRQLSFFEKLKAETGSIMMATALVGLTVVSVACILGAVGLIAYDAATLIAVSVALLAAAVYIAIRLAIKYMPLNATLNPVTWFKRD